MKIASRLGMLFAAFILFGMASAKADTMDYTLTGPGVSETFSVSQNPSFTGSASTEIVVPVSGLSSLGVNAIDLFSSSDGGGLGAILNFGSGNQQYQLDGPQLYSVLNGVVTLATGNFTLSSGYSLKAVDPPGPTATPEPSTVVLLFAGLAGMAMFRKRTFVNAL